MNLTRTVGFRVETGIDFGDLDLVFVGVCEFVEFLREGRSSVWCECGRLCEDGDVKKMMEMEVEDDEDTYEMVVENGFVSVHSTFDIRFSGHLGR
ncbi:hypothetical protein LWI28_022958 [Acer negundo]|uniref:Uncharacterized protein n=1 Tax=Acer negundo TaxID=4023 RepID=A0AAD5ISP4_ACENE|nr:hypothetical protein LWI28_022958 [Acer negundo]